MTTKEAMANLENILEEATRTEDSVCYVTSEDAETLKIAIKVIKNQTIAEQMLKDEKDKYPIEWKRPDLSRGRISAFYDALGIDYSD